MSDTIRSSGGIIVPIEGDLSKLKEKLGEVKRIAANPDLVKITPQMSFDERQVSAQVNKIIRKMQLDAAKQTAQVQLFGEAPQPVKLKPRFTVDQQALRDGMAIAKREIRAAAQAAIKEEATIKVQAELVGLAGSHNGGIEGRDFLKPRNTVATMADSAAARRPRSSLGKALRLAAGGYAVTEGLRVGGEVFSYENRRLARSSDVINQGQYRQNLLQTAESVPIAGNIVSFADKVSGYGVANARNMADEADRRSTGEVILANSRAITGQIAAARGDTVGAAIVTATEGERAARKRELLTEGDTREFDKQRELNRIQVQRARDDKAEAEAKVRDIGTQAAFSGAAATATLSGNGRQVFALSQAGERAAQNATARGRISASRGLEEFALATQVNAREASALAAKQALAIDDEKKRRAVDTESAIAAASDATLRTQHRGYEADLKAFDANAKQKLSVIRDVEAKQNEATRLTAQRQILVFDQTQQIIQAKASLVTAGAVATLTANRQNQAAQLKAFDDATTEQVKAADAAIRPDLIASRATQRASLIKQQGFESAGISNSLRARRFQARAMGNNEDQLAEVIGQVAAQREEVRSATDATNRGELLRTQYTELKAERKGLMRPRGYLQAVDPLSELPGGPGGDEGKQMVDILKLIDRRMQQLVQQGGGAVLQ